jgi:hypothetical protein
VRLSLSGLCDRRREAGELTACGARAVADTLSGRRGAGWMQKYESAVQMAKELVQELRAQGRRASRQDQAACEDLGMLLRSQRSAPTQARV